MKTPEQKAAIARGYGPGPDRQRQTSGLDKRKLAAIPVLYRGYRIQLADWSPSGRFDWEYVHEDYDPTPTHAFDGPSDHRYGRCASEQECREEIDLLEDEG